MCIRDSNNNGLENPYVDKGVGALTGRAQDEGLFKVPSLRNVALTAPYMHDGRFATLREVVDHYAGGSDPTNPSKLVRGFAATEEEKTDLIAFLESLTDQESLTRPELADPWVR